MYKIKTTTNLGFTFTQLCFKKDNASFFCLRGFCKKLASPNYLRCYPFLLKKIMLSLHVNPIMDPLVYNILPNFRNSSLVAENSVVNAKAEISKENARRYQESLVEKPAIQNTLVSPALDRLIGLPLHNFRSSINPAVESLKNALAQIGREKAGKVVAVNKAFHRGDVDTAEYYLGRSLTEAEKTAKDIDFIRETKTAKIREETKKAIAAAIGTTNASHVPQAPPLVPSRPLRPTGSTSAPGMSSSSSTASTTLAPTVIGTTNASHVQQLAAASSSSGTPGGYAVQTGPSTDHLLSKSALAEIAAIRKKGGNHLTQITDINQVLGSEQKDLIKGSKGNPPSTKQLLDQLKHRGYTGNGLSFLEKKDCKKDSPAKRLNVDFGRYTIDKKKLANGVLSFAYKGTNHTVTNLPSIKISAALKGVILEIINEMPVNLNVLSPSEMEQFNSIMKAAKKTFTNKLSNNNNEQLNRLSILTGEIAAGNTSRELKSELSQTLNSLHKAGLISAKQSKDAHNHWIF